MKRNIMKIDEEKCIGCGLCINACQEGAIQLIDGKAKLISESYCDGLGNCLPECPTGAITLEERVAVPFDKKEAELNMEKLQNAMPESLGCGCPGSNAKIIDRKPSYNDNINTNSNSPSLPIESQLNQWPCQIQLVPVNAPYFENAKLLVAADCAAYAYANIHNDFMKDKITIIGCPKLDNADYAAKLTQILKLNNIKSVTVLRMSVPCCGGLLHAVQKALMDSNKMIPWQVVVLGTDGTILDQ